MGDKFVMTIPPDGLKEETEIYVVRGILTDELGENGDGKYLVTAELYMKEGENLRMVDSRNTDIFVLPTTAEKAFVKQSGNSYDDDGVKIISDNSNNSVYPA